MIVFEKMNKGSPTKKKTARRQPRRGGPAKPLFSSLAPVTKRLFRNRGLGDGGLVVHWGDVVGAELAQACAPYRINYPKSGGQAGTLYLTVVAGAAPLVQHNQEVIIERTNAFFGYRAIAKLSLSQGTATTFKAPLNPAKQSSRSNKLVENRAENGESARKPADGRARLQESLQNLESTLTRRSRKSN